MIKTLARHVRGYVRESVLTPLFMILEVIMETIIPWLMSVMIDEGVNKGNMQQIIITGLWMLLCALIALFAGAMGGVYGAKASAGFAKNLRQAMFENIQSFSFANIDKYSTAGLVTRMTTDVTNLQNAYQMLLRICFRAPVNLIAAMTMTLVINAKLARSASSRRSSVRNTRSASSTGLPTTSTSCSSRRKTSWFPYRL